MGYSGIEQVICKNGHYFERGPSGYYCDPSQCSCGAEDAWDNYADDTNGEMLGYVPTISFLVSEPEVSTCNLGHSHVIKQAVYRIPTQEETKSLQTYTDAEGNCKPMSEYPTYSEGD